MLHRFPDKPMMSSHLVLPTLPEGQFLAEYKMDGWRTVIEIGPAGCTFTSRHNKPIPVSGNVAAETYQRLKHLPIGTLLDSEWMSRRAASPERFWIFDVLRYGADWWLDMGATNRFRKLRKEVPVDLIVPYTFTGYVEFFELSKSDPATEGIVLKRCDSKYIGSVRQCRDNPGWLKVRYRDGSDGKKLAC